MTRFWLVLRKQRETTRSTRAWGIEAPDLLLSRKPSERTTFPPALNLRRTHGIG